LVLGYREKIIACINILIVISYIKAYIFIFKVYLKFWRANVTGFDALLS